MDNEVFLLEEVEWDWDACPDFIEGPVSFDDGPIREPVRFDERDMRYRQAAGKRRARRGDKKPHKKNVRRVGARVKQISRQG